MTPGREGGATRLAGYFFALGAGTLWGTTGPLSTALYAAGAALTGIGFWRILLGTLGLIAYGLFQPGFFRIDQRTTAQSHQQNAARASPARPRSCTRRR